MDNSKKGTLNTEDFKQIAIKLAMVAVAAAIPAIIEQIKLVDFGTYQIYATGVVFMLQYVVQRLLQGK